jgi:hypothetical protein
VGERTVNLAEGDGQVRVTNGAGEESVADAAAIPLSEEPVIVEGL